MGNGDAIRGHSLLRNTVRGGGGQPLCYAMMTMVGKMVYYVLRRGGGGDQNMFKMVFSN